MENTNEVKRIKEFFKSYTKDDTDWFGRYFRDFQVEKVIENEWGTCLYAVGTMEVIKVKNYGYIKDGFTYEWTEIIGYERKKFAIEIRPDTMEGEYRFNEFNNTKIYIK